MNDTRLCCAEAAVEMFKTIAKDYQLQTGRHDVPDELIEMGGSVFENRFVHFSSCSCIYFVVYCNNSTED